MWAVTCQLRKEKVVMKYNGISDIGKIRDTNQDSYIIVTNENKDVLALVCDGIGGGKSGDIASSTTTRFIAESFAKNGGFTDAEEAKLWLKRILLKVNDYIFTMSTTEEKYEGMGTTLVGVLICNQGRFVANVGDSRAYFLCEGEDLVSITEDHNMATELYQMKLIKKEDIEKHPQRNVLTNAIGVVGNIKVDIFPLERKAMTLLLATDGLHGYVKEEEIKKILDGKKTLQRKTKQLVSLANDSGGYDNTTIILIELKEGE